MKPTRRRSGAGFTLVEVMVALGVAAIGMMALLAWFSNMSSQQGILSQNMVAAGVQSTLTNLMNAPAQCTGNLKGLSWATPGAAGPLGVTKNIAGPSGPPTFPSTSLNVYPLNGGAALAKVIDATIPIPNGFGLGVSSVTLGNLTLLNTPSAGAPNYYTGTITLSFSPLIPPHTPATASVVLVATSSGGNDTVLDCYSSSGGRTSCPAGYTIIGSPGTAEAFCISTAANPATDTNSAYANCMNLATNAAGQSAHLCTPMEWSDACSQVGLGGLGLGATQEWTSQPYFWNNGSVTAGYIEMGGNVFPGHCVEFAANGGYKVIPGMANPPLPYRCCFH